MGKKLLVNGLSKFFNFTVRLFPPKVIENALMEIALKVEKCNKSFFTYHMRPQKSIDIDFFSKKEYPEVGIVIQGPLVTEKDFTLETVNLYQKYFPKAIIVVSTWEDADIKVVKSIQNVKVEVLLNRKPKFPGALNANMQIVSTMNGISFLENKGIKYILKTRTDQRIYQPNSLDLFYSLIQQYPSEKNGQTQKIISINFTTLKYRPYAIGDMCMFGHITDLKKYWDIEMDERNISKNDIYDKSIKELCKMNVGESFYCSSYLNKIGETTPLSINHSWNVYRQCFIVVDHEVVDLYWFKYDRIKEFRHRFYRKSLHELFTYADWTSDETIEEDEIILNKKDGQKL